MFKIEVGQKVGVARIGNSVVFDALFSTVVKMNKLGHITLESGQQFDKFGRDRKEYSSLVLLEVQDLEARIQYQTESKARRHTASDITSLLANTIASGNISPERKSLILELVSTL